jgi:hypothetical protein
MVVPPINKALGEDGLFRPEAGISGRQIDYTFFSGEGYRHFCFFSTISL